MALTLGWLMRIPTLRHPRRMRADYQLVASESSYLTFLVGKTSQASCTSPLFPVRKSLSSILSAQYLQLAVELWSFPRIQLIISTKLSNRGCGRQSFSICNSSATIQIPLHFWGHSTQVKTSISFRGRLQNQILMIKTGISIVDARA